jgi:hypothetical protein
VIDNGVLSCTVPQFLRRRTHHTRDDRRREFRFPDDLDGSFFSFACDADGVVDPALPSYASFERCSTGTMNGRAIVDGGIVVRRTAWIEPAAIRCEHCSRTVVLGGYTNACDCSADYDMGGHRLAPREQWGEETGETAADLLGIQ